jgi:hypothetical protein
MKTPEVFSQCIETADGVYDCVPAQAPDERLRSLTESVLRRFVARLEKSGGTDLARHREILVDTLTPITADAEAQADAFLGEVKDITKVDIAAWAERVLQ